MTYQVFISYASEDKPIADEVCAQLEQTGLKCWIAPRNIRPGVDYGLAIVEAIGNCPVMIVILSRASNASQQVLREVDRGASRGKTVIPFRVEDVLPTGAMEYYLSSPHWLDALTEPRSQAVETLAQTVKSLLGQETGSPLPRPAPSAVSEAQPSEITKPQRISFSPVLIAVLVLAVLSAAGIFLLNRVSVTPEPHAPAPLTRAPVLESATPPQIVTQNAQYQRLSEMLQKVANDGSTFDLEEAEELVMHFVNGSAQGTNEAEQLHRALVSTRRAVRHRLEKKEYDEVKELLAEVNAEIEAERFKQVKRRVESYVQDEANPQEWRQDIQSHWISAEYGYRRAQAADTSNEASSVPSRAPTPGQVVAESATAASPVSAMASTTAITGHYTGDVGRLEARFVLKWYSDGTVDGTYTYRTRGQVYKLIGHNKLPGTLYLEEYTDGRLTARAYLSKAVKDGRVVWTGEMRNVYPNNEIYPMNLIKTE